MFAGNVCFFFPQMYVLTQTDPSKRRSRWSRSKHLPALLVSFHRAFLPPVSDHPLSYQVGYGNGTEVFMATSSRNWAFVVAMFDYQRVYIYIYIYIYTYTHKNMQAC